MFSVPTSAPLPPDTLGTLRRDTRYDTGYGLVVYTCSVSGVCHAGVTKTLTDRGTADLAALEAIVRGWRSPP